MLSDISIVSVKNRVGIAQCVGIIFGPAYLNPLFAQVYTVNCKFLIFNKKSYITCIGYYNCRTFVEVKDHKST